MNEATLPGQLLRATREARHMEQANLTEKVAFGSKRLGGLSMMKNRLRSSLWSGWRTGWVFRLQSSSNSRMLNLT
jgi:hypothetical protein